VTTPAARQRSAPAVVLGFAVAALFAALGLLFSRPDVVAMGLVPAVLSGLALTRRADSTDARLSLRAVPGASADGSLHTEILVTGDAEAADVVVVQSERRRRHLLVPTGGRPVLAVSRALHSGPIAAVRASARGFAIDGAILGETTGTAELVCNVAPVAHPLAVLPTSARLTGMHGAHEGRRPGQGGDFRDIHAFVPGDELRRVDWRATARLARRPGDLLVRRTNTLSDMTVVIALDTADDLGEAVATWGSGDLERSGATSLDLARQAARSIANAAVATGDRVALHELTFGGRSVRSGAGHRHLARVEAAIAATGQAAEDARYLRTPPVPHGSVIFVLSTFFDGAASDVALRWRASGHRVVAVDVLPALDRRRLSREQALALRAVLAERDDVLHDLDGAGVDTVAWRGEADVLLRTMERTRR